MAQAVRAEGLGSVAAIGDATGAGTGCETCHPELVELLDALAGGPLGAGERERIRSAGEDEARLRIESSLFNRIVPGLPDECAPQIVWIDGLRVDVHLVADTPQAREWVSEGLCKWVCDELDVRFV